MRRDSFCIGLAAAAALVAAGCDELGLGPQKAASAPPPAPAAFDPETVRAHAGETYSSYVADAGAAYSPDAIGLPALDRTRVWRAMAEGEQGALVEGGGAQALVFRGCAETGCIDGTAVVAIDTANGAVFAAVRDAGGAEVLTPNERVEALLRLNSPSRRWDDPAPRAEPAP